MEMECLCTDVVMLRYGELFLKSEPVKRRYLGFLRQHINAVLHAQGVSFVLQEFRGRILVHVAKEQIQATCDALSKVFGVVSISPALKTTHDIDDIKKTAILCAKKKLHPHMTFAVRARRDGVSTYTSQSLAADVGSAIYEAVPHLKVNLDNPEYEIFIESRKDGALVYDERMSGPGGLPLGTQGRVVALLSAGIDSPVASWLMMKRGVVPYFLHINTGTYGGEAIEACTVQNVSSLSIWSGSVPLTLETIFAQRFFDYITSKPNLYRYRCVLCKRFMLQCARAVACEQEAAGVAMGDNIGQVASQTIDNLYTLTSGFDYPIFRPLLTYDKEEIITIARKIGTFIEAPGDTSCAAVPKKPSIAAPKKTIDHLVQEHSLDSFVSDALTQRRIIKLQNGHQIGENEKSF